jgi:3-polyprenyl-4-hydroxybenzoate decarboxylase
MDGGQVLFALGSRWQSPKAIQVLENQRGLGTDPSQVELRKTSKLVIDATRQLPEEGGRQEFPATNRALLEQSMPNVLAEVDRRYGTALKKWGSTAA